MFIPVHYSLAPPKERCVGVVKQGNVEVLVSGCIFALALERDCEAVPDVKYAFIVRKELLTKVGSLCKHFLAGGVGVQSDMDAAESFEDCKAFMVVSYGPQFIVKGPLRDRELTTGNLRFCALQSRILRTFGGRREASVTAIALIGVEYRLLLVWKQLNKSREKRRAG